jgi:cardiolipin synthase
MIPAAMTTANKVTIFRILLIPIFIVETLYYFNTSNEVHRLIGLICFFGAAILDGVDGYIARRYNQRSELGAILDPMADKLLLVSAVVLLSLKSAENAQITRIPLWLTAMILSRDSLLLLGMVVITMVCGKMNVKPRVMGKVATVLQMIMVLWTLLKWDAKWLQFWTLLVGLTTLASGLLYLWDAMRQLSASPKSSPTPQQ